MQAIIMAGGEGKRFQPYSLVLPKPLIPISDKPIMEILISQLSKYGFEDIKITTGYMNELIQAYFGNGGKWQVNITYSKEDKPLGTIGPLTLLHDLDDDFIVLNGDTLTNLDYKSLFDSHLKSDSLLTIASYKKHVKIDLGVLEINSNSILIDYIEKPQMDYIVSMGIYVLNKSLLSHLKTDSYFDFPSLVKLLLLKNEKINIYHFNGIWHDLGSIDNYEMAIKDLDKLLI